MYITMYSLTAVGGIQYTTEMAKKNNNNKALQHSFRGIKEAIVTDGSSPAPGAAPLVGTVKFLLAPMGIVGVKIASGPVFSLSRIFTPPMKWLWATSSNFKEYRITRATLVVVGGVASTAVGNFNVTSSKDYHDIFSQTVPSFATGPAGTSVASLASKDARFPLSVDSRWKIVSSLTATLGSGTDTFIPTHTIEDLSFCSFALSNNSSVDLGVAYVDYDVEFRGPVNPLLNS